MLKKVTLSVVLLCVLLTFTTPSVKVSGMEDDKFYIPPDILEIINAQAQAVEAWSVLFDMFTINDDRSLTYPDDFAGGWIDSSKLHIALTTDDKNAISKYEEILKGFDCVVYEVRDISLNELDAIRKNVFNAFIMNDFPIISAASDEQSNKIVLGFLELDDETTVFLTDYIERETPNRNIEIFTLNKTENAQFRTSLIGGDRIRKNSSSGTGYTLGMCGNRSSMEDL